MVRLTRSGCAGHLSRLATFALGLLAAAAAASADPELPAPLAGLDYEVEAWCADGDDWFAGDGEGWLIQYWLTAGGLVPVRTLATNPDVEQCVVAPGHVYFLDPAIGVLAYRRSPETEPVMEAVWLPGPVGHGTFNPARLALIAGDEPGLLIESAEGDSKHLPLLPYQPRGAETVRASVETHSSDVRGDTADDSVVITSADGSVTWILGADKKTGLRVYDLEGRELRVLPVGKLNNIDALPLADGRPGGGFLVAASNRTTPGIELFRADPAAGELEQAALIPLDFEEPYGLCMTEIGGETNVIVGDKTGLVERWRIGYGLEARKVASYRFDSLTEGCVVDRDTQVLYVGEEDGGVWAVDLRSGDKTLVDGVGNGHLVADVEGLDIHYGEDGKYLLASSQGDDTFVVYALPGGQPLLKFAIAEDRERGIDGVSETDGLAVAPGPLPGFPNGILVVQDGHNVAPAENQNFKIVDWRVVEALLAAP